MSPRKPVDRRALSACLVLTACSLALLLPTSARADDDAGEWLERMNEALTTRNYEGTFFHVRGGRVETLRIVHRFQDGQVTERLSSLDGSGREFIRNGNELTCYLPDQRTVLVERRAGEGSLFGNLPRFDGAVASFYDVRMGEKTRLMGRDVRVVQVDPRDEYRYGYRLWIDERTAMPLKTQLCDRAGDVVEQIVFASLTLRSRIEDAAFLPSVSAQGFRWLRHDPGRSAPDEAVLAWRALRLPPGFRMTSRGQQLMPGSSGPVSHMVFTDGVASVSVFIERRPDNDSAGSVVAPAMAPTVSTSQIGSSMAYSTIVDGHQVTAVGEVPMRTVRFIAGQVRVGTGAPGPAVGPAPTGAPSFGAGSERRAASPGGEFNAPALAPQQPPRR